jgi:spore maturation protein SpmA
MNVIFFTIVLVSFLTSAWHQLVWIPKDGLKSPMEALSTAVVESAAGSVELALGLIGVMTLFLGLMKVAEEGGILKILARLIRPLMVRLFPDVPPEHPAMGAMVLNLSANAMGLGNAATPFGIRAMQELEKLNPRPGTATDAMALFLAINTSSITLLPTGVIALRAAAGSTDPAGILPTTLFATFFSTLIAVLSAKLYRRFLGGDTKTSSPSVTEDEAAPSHPPAEHAEKPYPLWISLGALAMVLAMIPVTVVYGRTLSPWIIPFLVAGFLVFGITRKVRVYEVFVEGAKDGFQVAVKIIPYLVAILVAVGMFRASGAMDFMVRWLGPLTGRVGLPPEALPMALMRPLSGSGAYGIVASIIKDPAIGPDSYTGYLVSTLQGSTETTFYVMAVYFGAVQVRRVRYTLAAGLTADLAGIAAAVAACAYLYGRL